MPNQKPRHRPARVYRVHDPRHRELLATFEQHLDAARYADHLAGDPWDVVLAAGRRETLYRSRRAGVCPECRQPWRLFELRKREDEGLPMYGCGMCGALFEPGHPFDGSPFKLATPATYPELAARLAAGATTTTHASAIGAGLAPAGVGPAISKMSPRTVTAKPSRPFHTTNER